MRKDGTDGSSPVAQHFSLTDEDVEEFTEICKKQGISFTHIQAREEARNLLELYRLLVRPLPSEIAEHEREMQMASRPDEPPATLPLL